MTASSSAPAAVYLRKQAALQAGQTLLELLRLYRLLQKADDKTLFVVWPRRDRMVVIFDPLALRRPETVVSPRFVHHLSTALGGRRVVATNHRGVFLQIAYTPPDVLPRRRLTDVTLNLGEQPGPLHLPLGIVIHTGKPLWLPLEQMDSILVGGTRRMGKTNLLHTWIQALIVGGEARLFLWDGKQGTEFGRYAPWAAVHDDLGMMLRELFDEIPRRSKLFRAAGVASIDEYNRKAGDRLARLVLFVDEVAQVPEDALKALSALVAVGGALGIHPVLATQRPDAQSVQGILKANLATRIALPVPSHHDSMVILGRSGAEKLPKVKGRLLLVWDARLLQIQAYRALEHEVFARALQAPEHSEALPSKSPLHLASGLLTPEEERLAQAALERDGWFRIRDLADALSLSRRQVEKIARRWQAMGYLTPPQRDERGRPLGRRVTETLRALLEPAPPRQEGEA